MGGFYLCVDYSSCYFKSSTAKFRGWVLQSLAVAACDSRWMKASLETDDI